MPSAYEELAELLAAHLSAVNARGLLGRALREIQLTPEGLERRDIARLLPRLEHGIRLFLDPTEQARIRTALDRLCGSDVEPRSETVKVVIEDDVSTARLAARALCADARARPLIAQRVVTIVSELARNIASYTPGGALELKLSSVRAKRMIAITATDRGNGIANLDEVLSGHYQSKTGLGRGLSGVKRLADRFEVRTGAGGTRIEVEVEF